MNVVRKEKVRSVPDENGKVRTYIVGETLPASYKVPEDYYSAGIVEFHADKVEISEIKIKKLKSEVVENGEN
jgi:hypothetical protein